MIVNERFIDYINSLESGDSDFVIQLAKEAGETFVPIIRKETSSLLKTLVVMKQPQSILEVGTAIGYSAIVMSEHMPDDCRITTIEKYEKRIPIAKENFRRAGKDKVIELLEGDAGDILPVLDGYYDFIFMDAAKGQYGSFLNDIMRLLPPGGVLVSDNVLQDGDIIESRYAVPRRNRTIHTRMREYLFELKHNESLQTAVIPIGDGVAVSVRKK